MKKILLTLFVFLFVLTGLEVYSQVTCGPGQHSTTVNCKDVPPGYTEERTAANGLQARICGAPSCGWYWYSSSSGGTNGTCTLCVDNQD